MPALKLLFKQNSGKYSFGGQAPFMSLDEFQELIVNSNVCSDSFGTREIRIHFNLAKMTEINEVDFKKHTEMSFIEFIEALGRVAERLDLKLLRKIVRIIQ